MHQGLTWIAKKISTPILNATSGVSLWRQNIRWNQIWAVASSIVKICHWTTTRLQSQELAQKIVEFIGKQGLIIKWNLGWRLEPIVEIHHGK